MTSEAAATRAGALLGAVVLPYAVGRAEMTRRYHRTIVALTRYSPERFTHGALWTLPLSGLVVARPTRVGPKLGVLLVVAAVYLLWVGPVRAAIRFAAGHVVPTVLALVVILAAGAAASPVGHHLYRMTDTGISAGLAAIAGALVVLAWRRDRHVIAVVLASGLVTYFAYGLGTERLMGVLADAEHLRRHGRRRGRGAALARPPAGPGRPGRRGRTPVTGAIIAAPPVAGGG